MAEYTQANRALRITTPLGPDALLLERLVGEEAVSEPFFFQLDLLSEKPDIDPVSLLGKTVTIEIDFAGETRHINGIVSRFAQGERGMRLTRYRAEVVPWLWLLSLVRNSSIHQEKKVSEIIAGILGDLGVEHELQLQAAYEPRNYCAQYRETDLAFVSRLMEEEGIFYFHKHASGSHSLQLLDVSQQAPTIPADTTKIPVASGPGVALHEPVPRLFNVEHEQSVVSGKVRLWDHCFEMPGKNLEAEQAVEGGEAAHELYDYPGSYAQRFDGVDSGGGDRASQLQKIFDENARVAGIRAQEAGVLRRLLRADSNYPLLTAGHKFGIEKHYRADFNGEYFIVRVRHEASVENYENEDGAPFSYSNSFTCIPAALPFVPQRVTPRAVVEGAQTAVVVGPAGSEIFTDKYGRVKVQLNWDRTGKKDAGSSCWLRVSTPWAGKNWGMIAIPRVGSEVVVDFLEGDPDRPIITGMVYNADQMPPYALPANMTQSGIKSRSTQKGESANFNEIRFEDKKDSEQVYIHAEKNLDAIVENDETRKVGFEKKDKGDQTVEIFNNQTLKVGAGKGEAADGSQTVEIYKDQTVTLETGKQAITLKQGDRSVSLDKGSETVAIKMGNRTVTLDTGNDALTLKTGNLTTTLKLGNATLELDVGNATTKAKLGSIKEEAMQGIEMKVGQSSIKVDQMGVTIKGMMVKVKGLMTQVSADAMMTVKGAITMIN
jgi:type VI secretion system secreted protein VgrG